LFSNPNNFTVPLGLGVTEFIVVAGSVTVAVRDSEEQLVVVRE
jgi:hypothetical protein